MSFQGVYEFYLKEYGNHFVVDRSKGFLCCNKPWLILKRHL